MNKINTKIWVLIIIYIVLIYASLPYMRAILDSLYKHLGSLYLNIFVNIFLILIVGFLFVRLASSSGKRLLIYLSLTLLIFFLVVHYIKRPEERIHFVEYGILGYMVSKSFYNPSYRTTLFSLVFVFTVGAIDELIQWFLPNRVGDLRDIIMNTIGGFIGVCFRRLLSL